MNNSNIIKHLLIRLSGAKIVDYNGSITRRIYNVNVSFDPKEPYISIPEVKLESNKSYIDLELDWYNKQDLDVSEIGMHASTWNKVANDYNKINSNYGYLIFSSQNGNQYVNVLEELKASNGKSRRAIMYYTNPMMHYLGGKDHICTLAVGYRIIDGKLNVSVIMRSQDIIYGLLNDLPWQSFVLKKLCKELSCEFGLINWFTMDLHIYKKHFKYLKGLKNELQ